MHTCCAGEACLTQNGPVCCGNGEVCSIAGTANGVSFGICCAEGVDACFGEESGAPVCCGEDGYTCQTLTIPGILTLDVCCDGPPCVVVDGIQCCGVDQVCSPFSAEDPRGVCCDVGTSTCIYTPAGGTDSIGACCSASQTCHASKGCINSA